MNPPMRTTRLFIGTILLVPSLYLVLLLVLLTPKGQNVALYANVINFPFDANYSNPEKYGFVANSWRSFHIAAADGVRIGMTQMLPADVALQQLSTSGYSEPFDEQVFDKALIDRPTILYLHGNAGNRLAPFRLQFAKDLTGSLKVNVLYFDYRGYGDSDNVTPSEEGLTLDARAAWDWLISKGVLPRQCTIIGVSLGTGVGTQLTAQLNRANILPNALTLIAPYSSIAKLLETYKLIGLIPLLSTFQRLPSIKQYLLGFLETKFATDEIISSIKSPLLIIHALDDTDIIHTHGAALFQTVINSRISPDQLLPESNIVHRLSLGGEAHISRLTIQDSPPVIFGNLPYGGHNNVQSHEHSLALLREIMDL